MRGSSFRYIALAAGLGLLSSPAGAVIDVNFSDGGFADTTLQFGLGGLQGPTNVHNACDGSAALPCDGNPVFGSLDVQNGFFYVRFSTSDLNAQPPTPTKALEINGGGQSTIDGVDVTKQHGNNDAGLTDIKF